jgi:hypothetical protein
MGRSRRVFPFLLLHLLSVHYRNGYCLLRPPVARGMGPPDGRVGANAASPIFRQGMLLLRAEISVNAGVQGVGSKPGVAGSIPPGLCAEHESS